MFTVAKPTSGAATALAVLTIGIALGGCGISDEGLQTGQSVVGGAGGEAESPDASSGGADEPKLDASIPNTGGNTPDASTPPPVDANPPPPPDAAAPKPAWQGGRMVVAVGTGGRRMVSTDGVTWKDRVQDVSGVGDSDRNLFAGAFAQSQVIVVGGGCTSSLCRSRIMSFNGTAWSERDVPKEAGRLTGVAFGAGRWVAVGDRGPAATSTDGVIWKLATSQPELAGFRAIAFGKVGGQDMFVAVGTNSLRARSVDGLAWEHRIVGPPGPQEKQLELSSIAIGNDVAVAAGDGGRRVRSTDGRMWTNLAGGGERLHSVVFHDGKFWAYTTNSILNLSDDGGQSWTPITAILAPDQTVAVGSLGAGAVFLGASWAAKLSTSPEGVAFAYGPPEAAGANAVLRFVFAGP